MQREAGLELEVFVDGRYLTMEASYKLGGGRIRTSDIGR